MNAKSYNLNFAGYWRERNVSGLPAQSGIYGVYAATYNPSNDTATLNRLLYIGESENVRNRVTNHEKWQTWRRQLRTGEELCFNMAPISPAAERERAEAAMIYEHKPPCNEEYVNSFPYDQTSITTAGRNALMTKRFTVYRTKQSTGLYGLSGVRRW